jgi:hypothetical protein
MIWKYGFLAAALNIGLYLAAYLMQPEWLFQPVMPWIGWILLIVVVYRACQLVKQSQPEFPFRKALQTAFGIIVVATASFQLFYQLLVHWIDPGLIDLQANVMNQIAERMGNYIGLDPQDLRVEPKDLAFNFGTSFLYFCRSLLGGFLVAVVLAMLLKSPAPRGRTE